jgi:hypothetical protein
MTGPPRNNVVVIPLFYTGGPAIPITRRHLHAPCVAVSVSAWSSVGAVFARSDDFGEQGRDLDAGAEWPSALPPPQAAEASARTAHEELPPTRIDVMADETPPTATGVSWALAVLPFAHPAVAVGTPAPGGAVAQAGTCGVSGSVDGDGGRDATHLHRGRAVRSDAVAELAQNPWAPAHDLAGRSGRRRAR